VLELRRVLDLLLAGRRVGRVGDGRRRRLDGRLDHRLLAALGRDALVVGARPFGALTLSLAGPLALSLAGPLALPLAGPLALRLVRPLALSLVGARAATAAASAAGAGAARARSAGPVALAAAAGAVLSAALAGAPTTHRAEALAILAAVATRLAGGAETLGDTAAAARRVLVAEARLPAGARAVALGHDLALVDPDLDADAAGRRPRLDEAVVDVCADRVQRHAALRVLLGAAHLGAAEATRALHLHAGCAGADRRGKRALHRAAERHAVLELLRDRLR